MADEATITIIAAETPNLDTVCYRGSAPLSALARLSQADVFDQVDNPEGLQRDLSQKHARAAYDYVATPREDGHARAFPEVTLNVRDRAVVKVEKVQLPAGVPMRLVKLTFDLAKIDRAKTVKVSRIDGNHRLMFGGGDPKTEREALDAQCPFQLHLGLSPEGEAALFLDINAEQKGLNTSHLNYLRSRLTPDDVEAQRHPDRYFARRLADDAGSPWHGLVHLGGSKVGWKATGEDRPVAFQALEGAVRRILNKAASMQDMLTDRQAQYQVLRSYFAAAAATWPQAFEQPREYLLAKGVGLAVLGQVGGVVIERCLMAGDPEQTDMEAMLAPLATIIDWHRDVAPTNGGAAGMSGNRAALQLAAELLTKLPKSPAKARETRAKRAAAAA